MKSFQLISGEKENGLNGIFKGKNYKDAFKLALENQNPTNLGIIVEVIEIVNGQQKEPYFFKTEAILKELKLLK